MPSSPDVSVLLPVRNEAASIDGVLDDLLNQDFAGELEVIVADGDSTDATIEKVQNRAATDTRVRLVHNALRHQAPGLNLAASTARAPILLRADGHTRYASDYVARSVVALRELGGAVGGRMNPVGQGNFSRAVAAAMNSPLTMGPARFHHATGREEVDTVYLGCFEKRAFEALDGFRRFPSGSSEDADFYYRWRRSGRKVHVDPDIRSFYSPRNGLRSLFRQYWRYGQGKSEMLWANGRLPSPRPLAPLALVLALFGGVVVWVAGGNAWPVILVAAAWLGTLGWVGLGSDEPAGKVMGVAITMHFAYGMGMLWGLLRGPIPAKNAS